VFARTGGQAHWYLAKGVAQTRNFTRPPLLFFYFFFFKKIKNNIKKKRVLCCSCVVIYIYDILLLFELTGRIIWKKKGYNASTAELSMAIWPNT
jgi:hypothetical protein